MRLIYQSNSIGIIHRVLNIQLEIILMENGLRNIIGKKTIGRNTILEEVQTSMTPLLI